MNPRFLGRRMSSGVFSSYIAGFSYVGLKSSGEKQFQGNEQTIWARKTVSNGAKISCMKTWNPVNNKKYETLSYLPPMTDESIAREIEYMISKGWIPCLEFDELGHVHRSNSRIPGYYDGRYWTLWKLPMFGCSDSSQVLQEIDECKKAYPNAFIRCFAFDSKRNTQSMSFLVQKPSST